MGPLQFGFGSLSVGDGWGVRELGVGWLKLGFVLCWTFYPSAKTDLKLGFGSPAVGGGWGMREMVVGWLKLGVVLCSGT